MKLISKVHTGKHAQAGPRAYYTSLAMMAMVNRCNAVASRGDLLTCYAMPKMLVTTFTIRGALITPPSCFECHAAQTAINKQREDEWTQFARQVNTATKHRKAQAAEKLFWLCRSSENAPLNAVYFGISRDMDNRQ